MRVLLSILMTVCLVMQATFGCCRSGCPGCAHEACDFDGAPVSIFACHHDHDGSAEPCPCESQCRGVCNYVVGSKVWIERPASSYSAALAAAIPVNFAARSPDVTLRERWEPPGSESQLPLRLHLLNQVWLI